MVGSHVTQSVSCINADYAYVHIHVTAGIPMSGRRFTKPSFGLFQTSPLLLNETTSAAIDEKANWAPNTGSESENCEI